MYIYSPYYWSSMWYFNTCIHHLLMSPASLFQACSQTLVITILYPVYILFRNFYLWNRAYSTCLSMLGLFHLACYPLIALSRLLFCRTNKISRRKSLKEVYSDSQFEGTLWQGSHDDWSLRRFSTLYSDQEIDRNEWDCTTSIFLLMNFRAQT